MKRTILVYFLGLLIFFAIDLVWLGFFAKDFYRQELDRVSPGRNASFLRKWPAVLLTYLLMSLGLVAFVLPKASTPLIGSFWAALLGLIIYGVYDLTNFLTLANWSLRMVMVDVAWGAFLNGLVAYLVIIINRLIK